MTSILYIEDDAGSREVMEFLLTRVLDYTDLTLFKDTAYLDRQIEATGKIFDIVFLDLNIHPIDGYQACEVLLRHPATCDAIIVGLTAHASPADQRQMRASGFDAAISKPIDYRTFPAYLDRIIQKDPVWEID